MQQKSLLLLAGAVLLIAASASLAQLTLTTSPSDYTSPSQVFSPRNNDEGYVPGTPLKPRQRALLEQRLRESGANPMPQITDDGYFLFSSTSY